MEGETWKSLSPGLGGEDSGALHIYLSGRVVSSAYSRVAET